MGCFWKRLRIQQYTAKPRLNFKPGELFQDTNLKKCFNCSSFLAALLSGLSPLIFPAWLHLPEAKPLPAEFAGSQRHTSPSTTARWQSMRGDVRISLLGVSTIANYSVVSYNSWSHRQRIDRITCVCRLNFFILLEAAATICRGGLMVSCSVPLFDVVAEIFLQNIVITNIRDLVFLN